MSSSAILWIWTNLLKEQKNDSFCLDYFGSFDFSWGVCVRQKVRTEAIREDWHKKTHHTGYSFGREKMNERTLKDIESELKRARRKHPLFANTEPRAVCIIAEEFGEMAQAVNDSLALGRNTEEGEIKMLDARMEALHVIATCIRFLEEL